MSDLIEHCQTIIDKCHPQGQAFEIMILKEVIAHLTAPLPDEVQSVIDRLTDPKKSVVLRDYTAADLIKRMVRVSKHCKAVARLADEEKERADSLQTKVEELARDEIKARVAANASRIANKELRKKIEKLEESRRTAIRLYLQGRRDAALQALQEDD